MATDYRNFGHPLFPKLQCWKIVLGRISFNNKYKSAALPVAPDDQKRYDYRLYFQHLLARTRFRRSAGCRVVAPWGRRTDQPKKVLK
jgi:hypothetical protein